MSYNSKIEWTEGSWSPIVGCQKVSPGCTKCYAERMAKRQKAMGTAKYQRVINENGWTGEVALCSDRELTAPLRWRNPRKIFVDSMSDMFYKKVRFEWVDLVIALIALCPQHIFQLLTKRPERMKEYFLTRQPMDDSSRVDMMPQWYHIITKWLDDGERGCLGKKWEACHQAAEGLDFNKPLPNLWLGTTVENPDYLWRIKDLIEIPAAKRFISIEPCLSSMDLLEYLKPKQGDSNHDERSRNNVPGANEGRDVHDGQRGQGLEDGPYGGREPEYPCSCKTSSSKAEGGEKPFGLQNNNVHSEQKKVQGICTPDSMDGPQQDDDSSGEGDKSHRREEIQQSTSQFRDSDTTGKCTSQLQGVGQEAKRPKGRKECNGKADESTSFGNKEIVCEGRIEAKRDSDHFSDNTKRGKHDTQKEELEPSAISWLIIGCETGPGARPCKIDWIRDLAQQGEAAGLPVLIKKIPVNGKPTGDIDLWPPDLRKFRQMPER